ncbi:MAG: hypothetical protein KF795_29880 [Labilithrix sp.]|nr:hypothetical protein [Labilithrix sp.]
MVTGAPKWKGAQARAPPAQAALIALFKTESIEYGVLSICRTDEKSGEYSSE